jgi:hypothetical protein
VSANNDVQAQLRQLLAALSPEDKAALVAEVTRPAPEPEQTPADKLLANLADHRLDSRELAYMLKRVFAKLGLTGDDEADNAEATPAEPATPYIEIRTEPEPTDPAPVKGSGKTKGAE